MTRIERRVHKTPDDDEPIVDERRTVKRIVGDNATVEQVVSERQSLPLNETEREHWLRDPLDEPNEEALELQSRAVLVSSEAEHVNAAGEPIMSTTLITQHTIPEAEPQLFEQSTASAADERERRPSPSSPGLCALRSLSLGLFAPSPSSSCTRVSVARVLLAT